MYEQFKSAGISAYWVVPSPTKLLRTRSFNKKTTNINNFWGLSRELGGVNIIHVLPFSWGKAKHINQVPSKSQENARTVPGQSPGAMLWKYCFYVLLFFCFFLPRVSSECVQLCHSCALLTFQVHVPQGPVLSIEEPDLVWRAGFLQW